MNQPLAWLVKGFDGHGHVYEDILRDEPIPDTWATIIPLYAKNDVIPFAELKEIANDAEQSPDDLISVTASRFQWQAVNKAIEAALYWSKLTQEKPKN
jgi:hypothetical protein